MTSSKTMRSILPLHNWPEVNDKQSRSKHKRSKKHSSFLLLFNIFYGTLERQLSVTIRNLGDINFSLIAWLFRLLFNLCITEFFIIIMLLWYIMFSVVCMDLSIPLMRDWNNQSFCVFRIFYPPFFQFYIWKYGFLNFLSILYQNFLFESKKGCFMKTLWKRGWRGVFREINRFSLWW